MVWVLQESLSQQVILFATKKFAIAYAKYQYPTAIVIESKRVTTIDLPKKEDGIIGDNWLYRLTQQKIIR